LEAITETLSFDGDDEKFVVSSCRQSFNNGLSSNMADKTEENSREKELQDECSFRELTFYFKPPKPSLFFERLMTECLSFVSVLDNEENGSTHDWTKVVRKRVRNRRTPFQATDEGLQPTGEGLQPTDVRNRRTPFQATDEGLQPTDGIRQSASQWKGRHDEGTGGHVGPRKATRSRMERKVEKR
jgi:hypothetical protein